jgi:hypothetical protein
MTYIKRSSKEYLATGVVVVCVLFGAVANFWWGSLIVSQVAQRGRTNRYTMPGNVRILRVTSSRQDPLVEVFSLVGALGGLGVGLICVEWLMRRR